ncbi:MAG: 50S ribosomal protein L10 [Microthrixaceae bacterium]
MENPRPEKVAVVEEVREKFAGADAVLFTEYRGLTVGDLQELRTSLRQGGAEYKVYKNTLVRRATSDLDVELGDWLLGPTALAFVSAKDDGSPGDAVVVAKALKAFAKANPNLVLKGGLLGSTLLDQKGLSDLAEVAPREELLARLAGGMAAPMRNFAGLLQAVPQKMAYALQALIDQGGAPGAPAPAADATDGPTDTAEEAPAADEADTDTNTTDDTDTNDDTPAEAAGAADEATPAEAADEQE